MPAKLTTLGLATGQVVLDDVTEGWTVDETGGGSYALGAARRIPAGSYEGRARATTTQPGTGPQFAREVYVMATSSGDLIAVETHRGRYVAADVPE